jgi:hypothetical protein
MLPVQSSCEKYFDSLQTQITSPSIAFRPDGGAFRDRHGRGEECGGRDGAADDGANADGEVVWS